MAKIGTDQIEDITLAKVTDSGALAALDTAGTAQVDDEAITNAKLAHVATDTIKGRTTAGTGDVEDMTPTQVRTLLDLGTQVRAGTSAPASTSDIWFHTTDLEFYLYDSSRTEWLGPERSWNAGRAGTTTTSWYLRSPGNIDANVSQERGFPCGHDLKVTGWTWWIRSGTSSRDIHLGKYDLSATSSNTSIYTDTPSGTWSHFTDHTLDVDYDEGDLVGVRLVGTNSAVDPRCEIFYKRRPS